MHTLSAMPGKRPSKKAKPGRPAASKTRAARSSALLDTRIVYCGDCLDQLARLPDGSVDLIYIDPPFNSNRNCCSLSGQRCLNAIAHIDHVLAYLGGGAC